MITRATEWMSGRWWATLAVALAFILVARTGTVGAPAEARTDRGERLPAHRLAGYAPAPPEVPPEEASAQRIGELEGQLRYAQAALRMERERSGLLQTSHDRLAADLERLGDRVRTIVGANALEDPGSLHAAVPMPIEALFVREPSR